MKKTKRILGVAGLMLATLSLASCDFEEAFSDKPEADMSNVYFEDRYFQYDGEEKTMKIIGELPEGVRVSYTNNVQKDKGTYEVTATFTSSDYKKIEPMTATMSIIDLNVGSYPQSVVKDKTLHDNIIKYGTFNKTTGLMTYNGKEYEILRCNDSNFEKNSKDNSLLSDGTIMIKDEFYVFEIEPIKWQILDKTDDGHYILLAEDILDRCRYFFETNFEYQSNSFEYTSDKYDDCFSYIINQEYDPEIGQMIPIGREYYYDKNKYSDYSERTWEIEKNILLNATSRFGNPLAKADSDGFDFLSLAENNYEYSYVRKWLNDDFYNTAFNSNDKAKILKTKVDNSCKSAFEYYPETYYDKDGNWIFFAPYTANVTPSSNFWKQENSWNAWMSNDTQDYVYLPSANDLINIHYGFDGLAKIEDDPSTPYIESTSVANTDKTRACGISDYATCRGAKEHNPVNNKWYWDYLTRTPEHISNSKIYYVKGHNGQMFVGEQSYNTGIRPMITVKLDD